LNYKMAVLKFLNIRSCCSNLQKGRSAYRGTFGTKLALRRHRSPASSAFSEPVCRFHWPDSEALNAQLKQVILRRMEESPGVVKTNRGGWQSKADLQNWPEECVQIFVAHSYAIIQEIVRRTVPNSTDKHLNRWEMVAWADVNRKGALTPHITTTDSEQSGPRSTMWTRLD
jgi:hypothetical protein